VHRTLEELQSQLTDDDVLIEYFLQDSALHALYLTTSGIFWNRIHGGSKLNNAIRQVTGFCNPFEKNSISKAEYVSTARYLSEVLLEAADSLNPETAHYLIVPDAALTFLPFDVLLTSPVEEGTSYSDMPYLLRDQAISYYYSAQFIPGSGPSGTNSSHDFLAIAPEFGNESGENYRQGLSPIGQAAEEAGQLHTLLGGVLLTDTLATLENFLRNVKGKDIIHFATHAELNTDNAFDSRLIFGSDVLKDEQQVLYASEICSMDLDARLAVLSSCNTGSGEILNGEGVISLAWAFQYAGCESVAMSLFPLDDGSARRIMISFYGHLKDGMTKDESLRQAKLAFISGMVPAMTHPKYWAGIIVSGDQRALFENNTKRNFIIAGCLMLVGLVVAGIIRRKK
jgi:CHAT domain-containing protein